MGRLCALSYGLAGLRCASVSDMTGHPRTVVNVSPEPTSPAVAHSKGRGGAARHRDSTPIRPVFVDLSGRRRRYLAGVGASVAAVLTVALVMLGAGLAGLSPLSLPGFPDPARPTTGPSAQPGNVPANGRPLTLNTDPSQDPASAPGVTQTSTPPATSGPSPTPSPTSPRRTPTQTPSHSPRPTR